MPRRPGLPRTPVLGPVLGRREVVRRQGRLRAVIGTQVVELREERGVTQAALADAVGISPSHLSRIERGVGSASLDTLVAIGASMGADLGVRFFPDAGPTLRDRFQAPLVEALIRGLDPRWRATPEVPVPRAHGVIDLVLRDATRGICVACECQSELRRLEQVIRRGAEKAGALESAPGDAPASAMLLLRSTIATRAIARTYEATLTAAFPARTVDAVASLFGSAAWPGPAVVWARLEHGRAEILDRPPRGVRVGR